MDQPSKAELRGATPFPLLVVVLASLTAFAPLSIDMYLPAFPQIARVFGVEVATVELSLATFFVGIAFGQVFYGTAADRFGRKRPLYYGLTVYCVASLVCAIAPNIETLIAMRFFQALGACAGIVIARAMIADLFEQREAARVLSLMLLVMGVAPILAPLLGGFVSETLGWRWIFGVVALTGAMILALAAKFLPETKAADPSVNPRTALAIYRDAFRDRRFLGYTLTGGFAQAGMFAYITGSPFVFIELFGVRPENYGWIFGSNAIGLIALSQLNGRLVRSFSPVAILRVCLFVTAALSIALGVAGFVGGGFWTIVIPNFLFIASLGMILPNSTAAAITSRAERAGSASALIGSLQYTLAAVTASLVSRLNDGTARSMTTIMAVAGVASLVIFMFATRGRTSE